MILNKISNCLLDLIPGKNSIGIAINMVEGTNEIFLGNTVTACLVGILVFPVLLEGISDLTEVN